MSELFTPFMILGDNERPTVCMAEFDYGKLPTQSISLLSTGLQSIIEKHVDESLYPIIYLIQKSDICFRLIPDLSSSERKSLELDFSGTKLYYLNDKVEVTKETQNGFVICSMCKEKLDCSCFSSHMKSHVEKCFCFFCEKEIPLDNGTYHCISKCQSSSNKETFTCVLCDDRHFKSKYNLRAHLSKHTGSRPHKCKQCEKTYTHASALTAHVRVKHREPNGNNGMACGLCSAFLKSSYQYSQHMKNVHSKNEHSCEQCGRLFKTKGHLKQHIGLIHTRDTRVMCEICSKLVSSRYALERHISNVHRQKESVAVNRGFFVHIGATGSQPIAEVKIGGDTTANSGSSNVRLIDNSAALAIPDHLNINLSDTSMVTSNLQGIPLISDHEIFNGPSLTDVDIHW